MSYANNYFEGVYSMKNGKQFIFAVAALCAVLLACAGSPPPPPPPVSAQSASKSDELDVAIRETSDYLNKHLSKGNKLMILNVQSDFPALSEYIIDELIANTVNDRVFSVVDRQQLDTIRAELDFQMSGEVDDKTAQALGRIAGAQSIISGAVSRMGDVYRLRVRALSVQSAQIEGQFNRNIPEGSTVTALVNSKATGYGGTAMASGSGNRTPAPAAASAPAQAPAPAPVTPAAPAAPPPAPTPTYKIGDKGPAGGFIFYSTEPRTSSAPPPAAGTFDVGKPGPAGGVVFYPAAVSTTVPKAPDKAYQVGDTGPAGGVIFYVNPRAGDWKYLEAAPASTEVKVAWSTTGTSTVKGTNVEIGTGKQNTQTVVNFALNNGVSCRAATVCDTLKSGGYDDWFLPSKSELNLMFVYLKEAGIGGFKDDWYWSSSLDNNGRAWRQGFSSGSQSAEYSNTNEYYVRAIRQF
jgi:hypothetical protein